MHHEAADQPAEDASGDPRAEPSSPAQTDHPLTTGNAIEAVNRAEAAAQNLAEDIDILDVDTLMSQVNALEKPPAASPSPSSTPSPVVDPPPAAPAYTPTITELDAALAGNVEELIEGDFATVDAILDRVFEDHAAIVADETGRVLSGLPQGAMSSPVASTPQHNPRVVLEPAPASPYGSGYEPFERLAPENNVADSAVIEAALAAAPFAAAQPSDPSLHPNAQPHMIPIGVPIYAPQSDEPAPTVSSSSQRVRSLLHAIVEFIGSVMISALAALNYPLRLMPASLRPVVNIFAVTLILWVPIVWSVAALGLNKARHNHIAADSAAHVDSHAATIPRSAAASETQASDHH